MRNREVNFNSFPANVDFKILPFGSYDVLIGMDWLEQHHVMLDCLNKSILCIDSQCNQTNIQGIPKKVSIRRISSLQLKKCIRKGYKIFAVNIQDVEVEREKQIDEFLILEEIPKLPSKWDLYFSIELS